MLRRLDPLGGARIVGAGRSVVRVEASERVGPVRPDLDRGVDARAAFRPGQHDRPLHLVTEPVRHQQVVEPVDERVVRLDEAHLVVDGDRLAWPTAIVVAIVFGVVMGVSAAIGVALAIPLDQLWPGNPGMFEG